MRGTHPLTYYPGFSGPAGPTGTEGRTGRKSQAGRKGQGRPGGRWKGQGRPERILDSQPAASAKSSSAVPRLIRGATPSARG
ncbi:hypothetical protein GCM10027187_52190 [Streptosporangium sandarakinum]